MKKETFMAILKEDSMILTEKQLWEMIDEELAKDPSEMDTDLVDLCLDALDGKFDDEEIRQLNSGKKRIKLSKVLLIAAVIVLILGTTVSVCAKRINLNTDNGVVNYTGDHFDVDMGSSESSVDVLSQLEGENINAVIPNELLKSEYVYDNYRVYKEKSNKTYAIDFKNKDIKGSITINSYDQNCNFSNGKTSANKDFENFEQITKNGMDILVFGDEETAYIYYVVDNIEYNIVFDCDYSTAYDIAQTL